MTRALAGLINTGWMLGATAALAIDLGDTPLQVRAELGEPVGQLATAARTIYTYTRGEIEFVSNAAVRIELISPEEAARRVAAQVEEDARLLAIGESQRAHRMAEGQKALELVRGDPDFLRRSAAEQVAYWQSFRGQYPEVGVDAEYAAALRLLDLEQRTQRLQEAESRRVADLEARVAEAERRASEAEQRQRVCTIYSAPYVYYPVVYTPAPRRDCRPPPPPAAVCEPARADTSVIVTIGSVHARARSGIALSRRSIELAAD